MSKIKVFMKLMAGTVIFAAANIISNLVYPMSKEMANPPSGEAWFAIPSLFIAGFIYSAVILFVCSNSRKSGIKLIVQLTALIIGVNVIMTQIETLYFQEAFPVITNKEMIGLFIRGILVHLIFVPATIAIFNKKTVMQDKNFIWSSSWWKYLLAVLVYVPVYLGFGMIAQLSPALQEEYAEWMMDSRLIQLLPLWTLFRGVLWTFLVFVIIDLFSKRKKSIIAVIIIFTVFVAVSLIHPSVLMSQELRVVHFFEIAASMTLYGFISAKLVSKTKKTST
jgi:hypothetical protein